MAHVWDADIAIDANVAQTLIETQFREFVPARVTLLGHGWDNEAYLVNEHFIFRFPRRRVAVPLLEREVKLLPAIAGLLPQPIPFPTFVGEPSEQYPFMFAGYSRLKGHTACVVRLTDVQRTALARPLGKFLRQLHAIDTEPLIARGLSPDEIGRLDHTKRMQRASEHLASLRAAGLIVDAAPFLDEMERIAPHSDDSRRVLVHGDLYARHLLLDDRQGLAGVIDWGDLHYGHPAIDLSIAQIMLPHDAYAIFRAAYGGVDDRTWELARYRAIYHSAAASNYALNVNDLDLQAAGRAALHYLEATASC